MVILRSNLPSRSPQTVILLTL